MARNLQENPKAVYRLATTGEALQIHFPKTIAPNKDTFDHDTVQMRRGFSSIPSPFIPPSTETGWGYGGVLQTTDGPHPDWITYNLDIPRQKGDEVDWRGITDSIATLRALLSDYSTFLDQDPKTKIPQLTRIHLSLGQVMGDNWGLTVDGTPAFADFLATNTNPEIDTDTVKKMHTAYKTMALFGIQESDFTVETGEATHLQIGLVGQPSLDSSMAIKPGQEFTLRSHNVKNPLQQLVLVTGIANLEGAATAQKGFK